MPLEVPDVAIGADPPLQYWATANLQRENETDSFLRRAGGRQRPASKFQPRSAPAADLPLIRNC